MFLLSQTCLGGRFAAFKFIDAGVSALVSGNLIEAIANSQIYLLKVVIQSTYGHTLGNIVMRGTVLDQILEVVEIIFRN